MIIVCLGHWARSPRVLQRRRHDRETYASDHAEIRGPVLSSKGPPAIIIIGMPLPPHGLSVGVDGVTRCFWCGSDPLYTHYHDTEWGFSVRDDRRLFEKMSPRIPVRASAGSRSCASVGISARPLRTLTSRRSPVSACATFPGCSATPASCGTAERSKPSSAMPVAAPN